jgi:hypothetical protein
VRLGGQKLIPAQVLGLEVEPPELRRCNLVVMFVPKQSVDLESVIMVEIGIFDFAHHIVDELFQPASEFRFDPHKELVKTNDESLAGLLEILRQVVFPQQLD